MTNTNQSTETTTDEATISIDSDVASIVTLLREEIRTRRQALATHDPNSAARNALERELQRCTEQLEIHRVVSAHWPLTGRNLFERARNLFNKVVRRYLRWYINPIVEQQNQFNDVAARTLRLLVEAHQELREQMNEMRHQQEPSNKNDGQATPIHSTRTHDATQRRQEHQNAIATIPADVDTSALQALIEQLGSEEPTAMFPDREMPRYATQLAQHQNVHAHWPLEEQTLAQKGVAFIHKLTRFYFRWMINPIVEQQNAYNAAVVEMIPPLIATDADMRAELANQRAKCCNVHDAR